MSLPLHQLPGSENLRGFIYANQSSPPVSVPCNFSATTDPTSTDDSGDGYTISSLWLNVLDQRVFVCINPTIGSAIWLRTDNAAPSSIRTSIVSANSFLANQVIQRNASGFSLAKADTSANSSGILGLIVSATSTQFVVQHSGSYLWPSHGFPVGVELYLSPSSSGSLTSTKPSIYARQVAVAYSNNDLYIYPAIDQTDSLPWASLTGVPSQFPPSAHTHPTSDILASGATTGQTLIFNGVNWVPSTPATLANQQIFSANGNFTVPAGVTKIDVEVVGSGGGGGGITGATYRFGTGGGSGSYARGRLTVSPGDVYAVVVGAPGVGGVAGNNPGGNGAASSFGVLISCPGGVGGFAEKTSPNLDYTANSANPTGGDLRSRGQSGYGLSVSATGFALSKGGDTPFGPGVFTATTTSGANGNSGVARGTGGSGGINYNSTTARSGGDGAAGIVIVRW
jgi:hypothetical protein